MKTTLTAGAEIGIPPEIRRHDHPEAGDQFDLDRVASGHYLLTRLQRQPRRTSIVTGEDGLPVTKSTKAGRAIRWLPGNLRTVRLVQSASA